MKKEGVVLIVCLIILLILPAVSAVRLPTVGGDVLNTYLNEEYIKEVKGGLLICNYIA